MYPARTICFEWILSLPGSGRGSDPHAERPAMGMIGMVAPVCPGACPAGLARQLEWAATALIELNSERSADSAEVLRAKKKGDQVTHHGQRPWP